MLSAVRRSLIVCWCVVAALAPLPRRLAAEEEVAWVRQPLGDGEELVVGNPADYGVEAQWYLRRADGSIVEVELGGELGALPRVDWLLPSPDGELLALVSSNSCGNHLEVIDLRTLRSAGAYTVLREVDPWPGTIGEVAWDERDLVLESDIALTYAGAEGRVDSSLLLPSSELFVLRRGSWRVEALTFSASALGDHHLAKLDSEEREERHEAALALAALGEARFAPALRARLRHEEDRDVRGALRRALASLRPPR